MLNKFKSDFKVLHLIYYQQIIFITRTPFNFGYAFTKLREGNIYLMRNIKLGAFSGNATGEYFFPLPSFGFLTYIPLYLKLWRLFTKYILTSFYSSAVLVLLSY